MEEVQTALIQSPQTVEGLHRVSVPVSGLSGPRHEAGLTGGGGCTGACSRPGARAAVGAAGGAGGVFSSSVVPLVMGTWLICMSEGQGSCVEMGP